MIPTLGITAFSGTGKTTLLKQLIPLLLARNIRPGIIKHTHHDMDIDKPGKDSYELRKAGALQTLVASQKRWALMTETPQQEPLSLSYLVSRMDPTSIDIVLVEGFKHEEIPKIMLYRQEAGYSYEELPLDMYVVAIASDIAIQTAVPCLYLNNPDQIADFIAEWLKLNHG